MLPSIGPLPRSSSPQLAPASWQPRQRLMWAHLPFISDAMNPVLQSSCPMLQRPICRRLHQASGTCASTEYAWVPPSCKRSCAGSPGGPCGGQQDGGRPAAALRPAGRQTGHLPEGDRCIAIHPAQTGGLSCSDGKCAAAHKLRMVEITNSLARQQSSFAAASASLLLLHTDHAGRLGRACIAQAWRRPQLLGCYILWHGGVCGRAGQA